MENKCNNSVNIEQKKHALTNTHSADRVLRNTVIEPIGLRKFTSYVFQYTTAGSRQWFKYRPFVNLQYHNMKT